MKRFQLAVVATFVLFFCILAFFSLPSLKPRFLRLAERLLHRSVGYQNLSVEWRNGPAITVDRLKLVSDDAAAGSIEFDKISAVPSAQAFMQRKFELSSVTVTKAQASVVRGPGGGFQLVGRPDASPESVPIRDFEATLKDVDPSKRRPVPVEGHMSVFGEKQNLAFSGVWNPSEPKALSDAHVSADLGKMEALKRAGVAEWSGTLTLDTRKLVSDLRRFFDTHTRVKLKNGRVRFSRMKSALEDVWADAEGGPGDLCNFTVSGRLAQGQFRLEGSATDLARGPKWAALLSVTGLELDDLFDERLFKGAERLKGIVAFDAQARAEGREPARLTETVAGKGLLRVSDMRIAGISVLGSVLEALPFGMPEGMSGAFSGADTRFTSVELPFMFDRNGLKVANITAVSDGFELHGQAQIMRDGRVEGECVILLNPQISQRVLTGVMPQAAEVIRARNDRIRIPLTLSGSVGALQVAAGAPY